MKVFKTAALLMVAALVMAGVMTAGPAGADGGSNATTAKKKKKKKCPAGTKRTVVKKGKKKKVRCVTIPAPPTTAPTLGATLSITPGSFDFGGVNQSGLDNCNAPPDPDCPTTNFVVTNGGPGPTGPISTSFVEIFNDAPIAAFEVFATTCTGPLAPGASCVITVRGAADGNPPQPYESRLVVTATPGGTASATMTIT